MTFELLISTMHKSCFEIKQMLIDMNVRCNCLVINQCDMEDYYEEVLDDNNCLRIFFTKERGLSKSRNMALRNANADIVSIADDDLVYYDNFDKEILNFYLENVSADVVLFNMDDYRKSFSSMSHSVKFIELSSFISMQCSFKIDKIRDKKIEFNELFGSGSSFFNSGEENIFLANCKKNKLKIFYCCKKILKRDESESTWFTTFNDEKFIMTRGATYYSMSRFLYYPYIFRFAIKYRKKLKPYNIFQSIKIMESGKKYLLRLQKEVMKCREIAL